MKNTRKKRELRGLNILPIPFPSKIVFSRNKIEKIGTNELSPGLLNHKEQKREIIKLNITTLRNLFSVNSVRI